MPKKHHVLVVDDEDFVRNSLADLLTSEGYTATGAASQREALEALERGSVAAVVTDLSMPSGDGLELLGEIRRTSPEVPVVLLTGVGTVTDAVRAMKAGAFDFIEKPVEPEQFLHVVAKAIEHMGLVSEVRYLRRAVRELQRATDMVGDSPALRRVRDLIAQVAARDATVLVTGESGTGKELVAAEIHRQSRRRERNLVRVNCAAVSESLFESEFFGHRRGSFTGAVADRQGRFAEAEGGTLVLDEIGTLRPEMQAKLLRTLETGEYQVVGESRTRVADVRVVAVTNEDLEERVRSGRFRLDLFYRLNVFPIHVPPLRERREDIEALANYFLKRARISADPAGSLNETALSDAAAGVLRAYRWPGNVRELRNIMERAAILSAPGSLPDPALLQSVLGVEGSPRMEADGDEQEELHLRRRIDLLERRLLQQALARTEGRKREAAALLGIDPRNLSYYMKKHSFGERERDAGQDGSQ